MNIEITTDKKTVIKAEKDLLNAMKNCDIDELSNLLHDDLLFHLSNGQTITKEIDLETYSSGNMKINEIKSSEQCINLFGDTAVVSVIIDMEGSFFDHSLDGQFKIIRIWKLFNEQLKVIGGSTIVVS